MPGWDCHGLPIELKVLQSMPDEQRRELTPIKLRRKARDFALKTVKAQREQFKRCPTPLQTAKTCYLPPGPSAEDSQCQRLLVQRSLCIIGRWK